MRWMISRTILLLAVLLVPAHSEAWIAYGFKSGMTRFQVAQSLSENHSLVVTEDEQQTRAGPADENPRYFLNYCSRPQKLYMMQYSLPGSPQAFSEAREKYEKRYGEPEQQDATQQTGSGEYLIWHLNEAETLLLRLDDNRTLAEFQDVSVCE